MTRVVNIRQESYDVYIGRAGKGEDGYFGNPFRLNEGESRGSTLEKYRKYFYERLEKDPAFKRRIHALKGKVLGCFCKPSPCHGDIIKEYLDGLREEEALDFETKTGYCFNDMINGNVTDDYLIAKYGQEVFDMALVQEQSYFQTLD